MVPGHRGQSHDAGAYGRVYLVCKINQRFRRISQYHAPGGLGVRMDSALYDGYVIPPYYDSMIAKLIVHGRDRTEALARLNRALNELIVDGVDTTIPLFVDLLKEPDIQRGDYSIHWLERWLEREYGG